MRKTESYHKLLVERLKDSEEAAAYLDAALEEKDPQLFLLALRNVAEAHGGMTRLSTKAKLSRESLYKMLSKQGNPGLYSLEALLTVFGLRLSIAPKIKKAS